MVSSEIMLGVEKEVKSAPSSPSSSPSPGRFHITTRELGELRVSVVLLTLLLALSVFHDKVMSNYGIPLVLL
jgi:hypothetical protein